MNHIKNVLQEKLDSLKEEALKILEELPQLIMLNGQIVLNLDHVHNSSYDNNYQASSEMINDIIKIKHTAVNNFNSLSIKNELVNLRSDLKKFKAQLWVKSATFTPLHITKNAKLNFKETFFDKSKNSWISNVTQAQSFSWIR